MAQSNDGENGARPRRRRKPAAGNGNGNGNAPTRKPDRAATQAALMGAALRLMEREGVLAGLSLQEVADEAGVNRGLIHYYFGSRRALLRSALQAHRDALAPFVAEVHEIADPWKRADRAFDQDGAGRGFADVVMLLALDGDIAFDPIPFYEQRLAVSKEEQAEGIWADDADLPALLVVFDVVLYGYFVMRDALAEQLGISTTTLDRRVRSTLGRMFAAFRAVDAQP